MPPILVSDDALDFMTALDAKRFKQIARKVFDLIKNPLPNDSIQLKGQEFRRLDVGEFRVIYRVDEDMIYIHIIGKRNDDEVYKELKRKG